VINFVAPMSRPCLNLAKSLDILISFFSEALYRLQLSYE
jgi:hypothetical protein